MFKNSFNFFKFIDSIGNDNYKLTKKNSYIHVDDYLLSTACINTTRSPAASAA